MGINPNVLWKMINVNGDEIIDREEYSLALEKATASQDEEQFVELTTRDGELKTISSEELFRMSAESGGDDIQHDENGNLFKEDEGELNITEIAKKNPELARFIAIGNWALDSIAKYHGWTAQKNISSEVFAPGWLWE